MGSSEQLVYCFFSSNVPQLLDPAFVRRAGGRIERFGRLRRSAFIAVLRKHLERRPFAQADFEDEAAAREQAVHDLTAWLFSPNGLSKEYSN